MDFFLVMFIPWSYSSFDKIWLFRVIVNKLEVASKDKIVLVFF